MNDPRESTEGSSYRVRHTIACSMFRNGWPNASQFGTFRVKGTRDGRNRAGERIRSRSEMADLFSGNDFPCSRLGERSRMGAGGGGKRNKTARSVSTAVGSKRAGNTEPEQAT